MWFLKHIRDLSFISVFLRFCQAQSISSFSSAEQTELALFSTNPTTHPHQPGKVYLEAVANEISTVEYSNQYVHDLASSWLVASLPLAYS